MRTLRRVRTLHASLHTEVLEVELSSPSRGRRRLALKRAQPDAPDEVRVRLQHEATVGMQLDHPVLGAVLDFDLIHGQPSLLLQLIEGVPLTEVVRQVRQHGAILPQSYALSWARDVALALTYLHTPRHTRRHSIVHCDISPSNILISPHGFVKLIDFGNCFVSSEPALGKPNEAYGTPGFMAPEQLTGEEPGPESDIFALGCIVHYLLTGSSPKFSIRETQDVKINEDIAEPIRELLRAALVIRRKRRMDDAELFAKTCEKLMGELGHRPVECEIGRWLRILVEQPDRPRQSRQGIASLFSIEGDSSNTDIRNCTEITSRP